MKTATATTIAAQDFDAIIFDLDGVVTDTARVHAAAWKTVFDDLMRLHPPESGKPHRPFDIREDYPRYLDGKPRYAGARDFLKSRDISLPRGDSSDPSGFDTVCAVANRKNALFQKHLETRGVEAFPGTLSLIRQAREAGLRTAVISSSRNCTPVLRAAGVTDLFDAKLDGADADRRGIPGKPAPDVFIHAARQLGVEPRRAVVIEDAEAGVEGARDGGFGLVIGIDRTPDGTAAEALRQRGATLVVRDLDEVRLEGRRRSSSGASNRPEPRSRRRPSALKDLDQIIQRIGDRTPAMFLDYDGTLTPIVDRPEDAVLSDPMRKVLTRVAKRYPVAIISGRDLEDVRRRVGLADLYYAGSHGFDVLGPEGPAGKAVRHRMGEEFLPDLDEAEQTLQSALKSIRNAQVERKAFSVAVHYRRVAAGKADDVRRAVKGVVRDHPKLRLTHGKKVFDIQPDIDWNKGRAVRWLMQTLGLDGAGHIPFYIGDDITDEDALKVVRVSGIGILVAEEPRQSSAAYMLRDPDEVGAFLDRLHTGVVSAPRKSQPGTAASRLPRP